LINTIWKFVKHAEESRVGGGRIGVVHPRGAVQFGLVIAGTLPGPGIDAISGRGLTLFRAYHGPASAVLSLDGAGLGPPAEFGTVT
jgi:hypothetical protein